MNKIPEPFKNKKEYDRHLASSKGGVNSQLKQKENPEYSRLQSEKAKKGWTPERRQAMSEALRKK